MIAITFYSPKCQFCFLFCTIIKNRIHNCKATAFGFLPIAGDTLSSQYYWHEKLCGFLILLAIRPETLHPAFEAELCLVYIIIVLLPMELGWPGDVNWSSKNLMLETLIQNLSKPMKISYFREGSDQKFRPVFSTYATLNTCLCPTEVSRTPMHLSSPRHAPVLCQIWASFRKAVNYSAF